jgi:hypothetical protein
MGLDWDANLLDPIYARMGFAANFVTREREPFDFVVLDKTAGVEIDQGGLKLQAKQPAACVRVSELLAIGLDAGRLRGGRLTFAGNCWAVASVRPKPKPGSKGELFLFLEEPKDG